MLMKQSSTGLTTDDYQLYIRIDTKAGGPDKLFWLREAVFDTEVDKTYTACISSSLYNEMNGLRHEQLYRQRN